MPRKIYKNIFLSILMASESIAFNCLSIMKRILVISSQCVKSLLTVLRVCISLRETLSGSITFTVINKFGKVAVVKISTVFGHVYHVPCQRVL